MDTSPYESSIADETEEEILIYADFDSVLDDSMFQPNSLFKVIALESDEPFLQIGAQMFSGKWLDTVGTQLFFEPEVASPPTDPVFSDVPNNLLNYKFKTRTCLELSRVFINRKEKGEETTDTTQSLQKDDTKGNTLKIEESGAVVTEVMLVDKTPVLVEETGSPVN